MKGFRLAGRFDVHAAIHAPAVADGTVYFLDRAGSVQALKAAGGQPKGRYDARGSWIVGTSDTGLLLALDKRTGRERYRFAAKVWTFASPPRVGDVVVAASMKGELHALDAATGRPRWSWRGDALAVNDGRVIDTTTGKLDTKNMYRGGPHALYSAMEHVKRLDAFTGSPARYDGRLIAATATGAVPFFEPQR